METNETNEVPIFTRDHAMSILRQAYEELDFEGSPTADDLADLIFQLAIEWNVELGPRP